MFPALWVCSLLPAWLRITIFVNQFIVFSFIGLATQILPYLGKQEDTLLFPHMALQGGDAEEHNVLKPTGSFKKKAICQKRLEQTCLSSHQVSCHSLQQAGCGFKHWKKNPKNKTSRESMEGRKTVKLSSHFCIVNLTSQRQMREQSSVCSEQRCSSFFQGYTQSCKTSTDLSSPRLVL